jgi:hypothetical protein
MDIRVSNNNFIVASHRMKQLLILCSQRLLREDRSNPIYSNLQNRNYRQPLDLTLIPLARRDRAALPLLNLNYQNFKERKPPVVTSD